MPAIRQPRFALAALLLLLTACQSSAPTAATTPQAPTTSASPSAAAAVAPSPSPGVAVPSPSASPSAIASPSPAILASQGGLQLDDYPFAVMIDNIKEARPHFGLADADVVYEAPAEGGIPRLMPIFLRSGTDVGRIGPVRSARHYFIYLANEYHTPIVHIGASPQGFDALSATGLPDVDEQRGDAGFVRDPNREAPHNAFVSTTSIRDVLRQRGGPIKANLGPLKFGDFVHGPQPATRINIPYPGGERYVLQYDYDADTHLYNRVMDGQPHLDGETGQQYAARSIIIQFADVVPIPNDDAGRLDVTLVGSGKGVLVADGTQLPLQWSRASVRDATQFKRTDGAPFALPSGQVWIQIVPLETQLSIT
jgi:DUF3048 family protein